VVGTTGSGVSARTSLPRVTERVQGRWEGFIQRGEEDVSVSREGGGLWVDIESESRDWCNIVSQRICSKSTACSPHGSRVRPGGNGSERVGQLYRPRSRSKNWATVCHVKAWCTSGASRRCGSHRIEKLRLSARGRIYRSRDIEAIRGLTASVERGPCHVGTARESNAARRMQVVKKI
jgi:hypothetical protein